MQRSLPLPAATALAALAAAAALVAGAGPATAQQVVLGDQAGDASGPGLDITRVRVANLDRAVVAKVRFVEAVRGDLVVSIDPRGGRGVRMVSEHDPVGHTDDFVLSRAFTDHRGPGGTRECRGFRVRWSAQEPTATMRMPSRCLAGGDYGAIRFDVLTERSSDTDFAAGRQSPGWIPRG